MGQEKQGTPESAAEVAVGYSDEALPSEEFRIAAESNEKELAGLARPTR